MGSQTDKLFRDKLKGYQRPVPPAAWNRVEKNLRGPRRSFTWMHIAAGILVLIISAFLLWPDVVTEHQPHDITSTLLMETTEPAEEIVAPDHQEIVQITPEKKKEYVRTTSEAQPKIKSPSSAEIVIVQKVTTEIPEKSGVPVIASSLPSIDMVDEQMITQPQITERPVSNTIVYTADEVQARFVKKKSNDKAAPAKQTAGQKIAGIATAIKNQEIGLSDLRDLKDDLLTFEFSSNQHKSIHTQGK